MNIKKYFGIEFWISLVFVIIIFVITIDCVLIVADEYDGNNKFAENISSLIYYFAFPSCLFELTGHYPITIGDIIQNTLIFLNIVINITITAILISQIYLFILRKI